MSSMTHLPTYACIDARSGATATGPLALQGAAGHERSPVGTAEFAVARDSHQTPALAGATVSLHHRVTMTKPGTSRERRHTRGVFGEDCFHLRRRIVGLLSVGAT